jgi:restriction endonuclease S subunit
MNNNFKQTEIGFIPEDWDVVRLGEVCEFANEQIVESNPP